jgi:puromycin-sensitive aminopeptidase
MKRPNAFTGTANGRRHRAPDSVPWVTLVDDPFRLPRTVSPVHYALTLEPDLAAATFAGRVHITLTVHEPTERLLCNALDLEIDSVVLDHHGALQVHLDPEHERLELIASSMILPGEHHLRISYRGVLNDKLRGFYRSTFTDEHGHEHVIATTQMEATDARRALPCWDEPDFKAAFGVTLVVDEHLMAVSNGAEIAVEDLPGGRRQVTFADTISMSSYLLAFAVGPFEATEPVVVNGTSVRVIAPRGKLGLAQFGLDAGVFALDWFERYYGIPYVGGKLDLVAVPDFAFGAMENIGCVIFRETLLLVDPEAATQPELQNVVDVISHELAHLWFGDLVTMAWWNGIWLNEAFATFMEIRCTDAYKPEWDRWTTFGLERSPAFDVDALDATRPIELEVRSPADAEGMFDVLTYQKGAAVLRMLEQYLGEDRFRTGVNRYLHAHQFANTETHDLWDALEAETGEPVRRMMDGWIFQGGHPVVVIENRNGDRITVAQKRFRADGALDPDARWIVPLRLRVDGTEHRGLLDGERIELTIGSGSLQTVNVGSSGFYRTRWLDEDLARIGLEGPAHLEAIERYQLVDDAWALTLAGEVTLPAFLDLVRGFRRESDVSVWQRILGALDTVSRLVRPDDESQAAYQRFVVDLVSAERSRLGDTPAPYEDDRRTALRGRLASAAAVLGGDTAAIARARSIFAGDITVDPAQLAAAVEIVAATADAADHSELRRRFVQASSPQDGERYRGALADAPGAPEIDATLAMTLSGDIRSQDIAFVLRRALRNHAQGPRAWAFVVEQWDTLNTRMPSNNVARMLEGVTALLDPTLSSQVESFLDAHPVPQGARMVAQHLEKLRIGVAFANRESDALAAWLLGR